MKILVIGLNYAPEPTGIAPYTAALSRGMAVRGHRVRVITTMPHYPEWRIADGYEGWSRTERLNGVMVRRLRHYVPSRPSGVRRMLSEISFGLWAMTARWGRPDVVLFVSPALFSTGLALLRANLTRTPSVVWVQDVYSSGMVETQGGAEDGAVVRFIRAMESAVLRNADGVGVIHARFAEVVRQLGTPAERIEVVRNWTHLQQGAVGDREVDRERLKWPPDETVVLHSGAMGKKQDLDNVIEAGRLADERGAPVRFVLMGNGGERARLEAKAEGVRSVSFLDPLPADEYQPALRAADALLVNEHAGLRDMAVPSKLTSYFSSGRPVIAATDSGSVTAHEVTAADAGLRIAPATPAALLAAALELRDDSARADALGRNGQHYQQRVLSETAAIDRFENLLTRVVQSGRERRSSRQGSRMVGETRPAQHDLSAGA
ncbi:WcaI family glycosyltransferase [Amnibacterium setariae]|uniref:D-inositol 3-phosphate glycosyltransferase n=1 Tax=Amnibacterium setariae TaxID=2306585 RepID=A0A3A1TX20_9MICO|nr:WcaI family glycosyltransferase [Amnibacterium setariae]RIX28803.1 colanic acid biosynthesis glycosyltransferase WcaI [Amnibacterium setariae]